MRREERAGILPAVFPATQWTDLARATLHGDDAGRAALESLCRAYWEPVRRAILTKGWSSDEAADLAQSFFLHFMEHGVLHRADRERGRFRTFLQSVLHRWLIDELRRRQATKRGGGHAAVALHEIPEPAHPEDGNRPDGEFDRAWAQAVMQGALARLMGEVVAKHGESQGALLGTFLGAGGDTPSYEDASTALGLSLTAFKSEVLTWRRRLREYLRAEVRRTVGAPHEIDEEMDYLRSLLTAA